MSPDHVYREVRVTRLHARLGDTVGLPRGAEILRTLIDRTPMGETWVEIFYLEPADDR